jgi:hypothetical protein
MYVPVPVCMYLKRVVVVVVLFCIYFYRHHNNIKFSGLLKYLFMTIANGQLSSLLLFASSQFLSLPPSSFS